MHLPYLIQTLVPLVLAPIAPTDPADAVALAATPGPTLALVENAGQWDSPARFHGRLGPVQVQLLPGAVQFQLARPDLGEGVAVRLTLEGGDPVCEPRGEGLRPEMRSFFVGSDPERWASGVRSFSSALYADLAPGVDLRVREGVGRMEWDLLLDAGVASEGLVMRCEGVDDIVVDNAGDLTLQTPIGAIRMSLPTSWTIAEDGTARQVEATYVRIDEQRFGFALAGRDRDKALVIDPGIEWSSYLGGNDLDVVLRMRQAQNGNVVVCGRTDSPDFPTTAGSYQTSPTANAQGFVSVFDPTGSTLLHSTYLSGSNNDGTQGLDLTPTGEVVVCGFTSSSDFPTTAGAYRTTKGFGFDGFVSRLSADLSTLEYSTYIGDPGGGNRDWTTDVEVDAAGRFTVSGLTRSTNFPVTANAPQGTFGGTVDAFVARIDPAGGGASDLVWATYVGGVNDESFQNAQPGTPRGAESPDLALGADGSATIAGVTRSNDFPTTPGAFIEAPLIGARDIFVVRISADGSSFEYGTLLGGTDLENMTALALDSAGRAVVCGATFSGDFHVTAGAFQPAHTQPGTDDGWLVALSPDGSALDYGTFLGASILDVPLCVDVEPGGVIVVGGFTQSMDFPITPGAPQTVFGGGMSDVFVTRLDPSLTGAAQLLDSTFFGGTANEDAWALQATGSGRVLIGGATLSTDLPGTAGAYDSTYAGGIDAYVAEIQFGAVGTIYCSPAVTNSTGAPGSISAAGSRVAADNDITLEAAGLPTSSFGFFLTSTQQGFVPMPGGSEGNLCLDGAIGRYVGPGQIKNSGAAGAFSLALDLTMTPTPTGLVPVQSGETWNFQAWYRDSVGGVSTSNFTDGISITFL